MKYEAEHLVPLQSLFPMINKMLEEIGVSLRYDEKTFELHKCKSIVDDYIGKEETLENELRKSIQMLKSKLTSSQDFIWHRYQTAITHDLCRIKGEVCDW